VSEAVGPRCLEVTGIVPCSGASRRMGRAKALLELGGRSFVARAVEALREGGCARVVVVVPGGDPEILRAARATGATVEPNPEPGEGPITSLRLALAGVEPTVEGVVYLPVDHPLVTADVVRTLIESARESGAPLVLPVHGGKRGHPAFFSAALFDELIDPSLEGGARTVVHRHLSEAALMEVDAAGVLANIDTPEAYEAAVAGTPMAPNR
jgi:molybdenum cofactor cytidylyltransferase